MENKCCGSDKKCCWTSHECALRVSGVIFGLVALLHLYRIFKFFPVVIGTVTVGENISYVALVVFGLLSFWMFRSAHKCCK